jgi:hypothetical protein
MEHGIHRLASFAELGHKPIKRRIFDAEKDWCTECQCTSESLMGHLPCGYYMFLGVHVARRASIREGRHAWDYVWDGKTIGWKYAN